MKQLLLAATLALVLGACRKEPVEAPTEQLDQQIKDTAAQLIYTGTFSNGPYGTVSGTAAVYKNPDQSLELQLSNFSTDNGPDLFVYLSRERQPVNFQSLGKLQSTNGNQVYAITGTPDFTDYKYICIHCKQYNHLFGSAELKQ